MIYILNFRTKDRTGASSKSFTVLA